MAIVLSPVLVHGSSLVNNVSIGHVPDYYVIWGIAMSAITAIAEEVLVNGYLITRLSQFGWTPRSALTLSLVLRTSYHVYYGLGFLLTIPFGYLVDSIIPEAPPAQPLDRRSLPLRRHLVHHRDPGLNTSSHGDASTVHRVRRDHPVVGDLIAPLRSRPTTGAGDVPRDRGATAQDGPNRSCTRSNTRRAPGHR